MSSKLGDDLLEYYQRELSYLRQSGAGFAERYPKVAARLELGSDESTDPHVERLIEAFAFLAARVHLNLDEELPEIASALLENLYPHYLNPIPSMSVACFEPDPDQGKLTGGYRIEKQAPLYAQTYDGLTCRFSSAYPVTLWPLEVESAGIESPDRFDFLDTATDVATVLRIRLQGNAEGLAGLDRLRFYLHGEWTEVYPLYDMLFSRVSRVALLCDGCEEPIFLDEGAILPVGFGPDEGVLPFPANSHPAYRLLQEYFVFPRKFMFFDVAGLAPAVSVGAFEIMIMFDEMPKRRLVVDRDTFRLGCTPIVNLFKKTTDPIRLDHRQTEYPLVPDVRRERTTEIHSILKVTGSSQDSGEPMEIAPFFAFDHHLAQKRQRVFWHGRRRLSARKDIPGTEMVLSFLDLDFHPGQPATQSVFAHTLCTNRKLAEQVPAGAILHMEEAGPQAKILCLHKPTPQVMPALGGASLWRLVSHLSLNHLSLVEGKEGLKSLREMLRLYATQDSANQRIAGIRSLSVRRIVRRMGNEAWRGFCRGTEITLEFDEEAYVGSSVLLMSAVLNRFFALYTSVNSFTQLVVKKRDKVLKVWKPTAGDQVIL